MLKRFSISLEEELLKQFDQLIHTQKYNNRSEAIRDLIRNLFIRKQWEAGKEVIGVISLVYDHHQRQLQEKITEVQHEYHHQIISATHIHVDHDNCLEVVIVRGRAKKVRELAESLRAIRGVKHGDLSMSTTGDKLS